MQHEVDKALAAHGAEYFRIECMKRVGDPWSQFQETGRPYYERFGEMRVQQGEYRSVIRLRQHMTPIMEAIRERAMNQPCRGATHSLVPA
jgi:hypothetical protein